MCKTRFQSPEEYVEKTTAEILAKRKKSQLGSKFGSFEEISPSEVGGGNGLRKKKIGVMTSGG